VHPTTDDTIKLMGGRAFRAPTMYEQFYWDAGSTTLRSTELGSSLSPEDFYQAELEYTHRFDTEWSVLADVHFMYAENFIDTVDAPASPNCSANDDGTGCVWYANVDADQLFWGGELEVRREFRNGWMLAANYGFLQARFVTPVLTNDGIPNDRIPNAPEHYFSARGIAPIVPQLLVIAARLTVEAPRRASTQSEVYTDGAVIADLVISGEVSEPGLRYSVGVYNLFDWGYSAPGTPFVDPSFTTLIGQQGRTFHASLQLSL
jgi:outer membrane receptor for ferrienterochelin and colicins